MAIRLRVYINGKILGPRKVLKSIIGSVNYLQRGIAGFHGRGFSNR